MLSNLTTAQKVGLALVTINVLAGASAQLTQLFGSTVASDIVTICNLSGAIIGGWMIVLTGQNAQVQNVAALPGVEKIQVNAQANQALAQAAVDHTQTKIVPTVEATAAVQATAKG
jgi:hypothetical protein